jgi:hypothetical protein
MWIPSWRKDGANCAVGLGEMVRYGRRAGDGPVNPQMLVISGEYILKQDDGGPDKQPTRPAEVIRLLFPLEANRAR